MVYLLLVGLESIVGIALFWRLSSACYSLPCPIWLLWFIEIDNPFAEENRAAKIIERLAVKEGMTIADIGCGTGRLTIPLIKSVGFQGFVVAVDMQKVMLEKVKRKLPDAQNLECIHANVGDGKLGKYKYDRIVMVNMLGEIPHQEVALQEVVQSLKPGGILSISETVFDPHYQRLRYVIKLAEQVGFKKKNVFNNWFAYTVHFTI